MLGERGEGEERERRERGDGKREGEREYIIAKCIR